MILTAFHEQVIEVPTLNILSTFQMACRHINLKQTDDFFDSHTIIKYVVLMLF